MKALLSHLAKQILPHPDDIVIVEDKDQDNNIELSMYTHPEDTGLAIGKGGKTVHALRELLKVKAMQTGERINLVIKSTDEMPENAETTDEQNEIAEVLNKE
ncbi:KH domain-containing protein [bacterium]|uniref:Uncharacterized protein n=2 Tax=Katanobacteria TaxID=422282 RepID=A0A2M7X0F0_UNCKA|nr:KH domain-containing protein [bacterium]PIP56297.1 MAG: hypothetical protein COX05_03760 [candidate division WWE3 bacterium CG22_combo_CG10-13_8_21_14_all_39_12]PJA39504.1 MAG: hypothetical protein CO179_05085 [candidate division WWE3 bacterium CG_4_9_14_3_um_filter_39_7]